MHGSVVFCLVEPSFLAGKSIGKTSVTRVLFFSEKGVPLGDCFAVERGVASNEATLFVGSHHGEVALQLKKVEQAVNILGRPPHTAGELGTIATRGVVDEL